MEETMERTMGETWMPITAGILDIISGTLGLIGGLTVAVWGIGVSELLGVFGLGLPSMPAAIFTITAVLLIICGLLAIVGGAHAVQRKIWWLAFAGSIGAFLVTWLMGMVAVTLTSLSKDEFE